MSKSILYIDDDFDDHTFFSMAVNKLNFNGEIFFANNGLEALQKLKDSLIIPPPSLILVDLSMPLMDGIEFLREKSSHSDIKDIPTYMYSTSSRKIDRDNSLKNGALDFFTKPNAIKDISNLMSKLIQKHAS